MVRKARMARIYRFGELLCVIERHPGFNFAKKEERLRLNNEAKEKKALEKAIARKEKSKSKASVKKNEDQEQKTKDKKSEEKSENRDVDMGSELYGDEEYDSEEERKIWKKGNRTKAKAKMVVEETENVQAKSKSSPITEPFVVDSNFNIHGEPIIPKEEPIDWDNIKLPSFFNIPQPPKKPTRVKKSKPPLTSKKFTDKLKLKSLPKPKPQPTKDDHVHICDIKEFSEIDLFLDELEEVRGIPSNRNLPERLVFRYKANVERTWPLQRILNEGYSTLVRVHSVMKRDTGFTRTAKTEVLNQIANIRKSWRESSALPRILVIPEHGITIHKTPHLLMEFRDEKLVRRFFRLEDQLKIASNETLREMQSKLDINEEDEAEFYRQLQLQIEENDRRLGRKTREQRKKK